jgi:hypothetical protein
MRCEQCGIRCDCEGFAIGDVVVRRAGGFTLTNGSHCKIVDLKEQNGKYYMKLELADQEEAKKDLQLAGLLASPDSWHNTACGWERA